MRETKRLSIETYTIESANLVDYLVKSRNSNDYECICLVNLQFFFHFEIYVVFFKSMLSCIFIAS